jgi:hypothetical protein
VSTVTQDVDTTLAWEKRHRPRAAIAAFIAAIGLLAFNVAQQMLDSSMPTTSGLETFQRAMQPGSVGELPSLQAPVFEYMDSKSGLIMVIMLGGLIGFIGVGWAVGFLAVVTRSRMPGMRRFTVYAPIVGGVVLGLSVLALQLGRMQIVSDFLDGPRTVDAIANTSNGLIQLAQVLLLLGTFSLAVGMVLVSLNAMRAGLLTRMLGYLGVAAGAMMVLVPLPIVQIFWLAALGFILLGRWPGGAPPAWNSGQAEPWPSPPPRQRAQRPAADGPSLEKAAAPAARRKRKKRN